MIVGLFGISGSGKTHLASSFYAKYDVITTRASQIIERYGHEIEYHRLNKNVLDKNQSILIQGLEKLNASNPNKVIIIELHNIIETPEGLTDIDPQVLHDLNLKAVCFLDVPVELLYSRRMNDSIRNRPAKSLQELEALQSKSRRRFKDDFQGSKTPFIILKSDPFHEFENFLKSLVRLHPKNDV